MIPAAELKNRLRAIDDPDVSQDWRVRVHRAISWLARSEKEGGDADARFIFQWIALNAAYAREFSQTRSERDRFSQFVEVLVQLDRELRLHDAMFNQFTGPIRTLIDNKYVFEPFWAALRAHDASERWKTSFDASRGVAMNALLGRDTGTVLSIVFDRLYVLRNQLVHGGATWNSQVNRQQVRDGAAILGVVLPRMLQVMLDHPGQDYGEVLYSVVGG